MYLIRQPIVILARNRQLAISGGQIASGYFNEAKLTEQRFPTIAGKQRR